MGNPSEQMVEFENLIQNKLDSILPQKIVKFCKPFITSDLKKIDRLVKREYKSEKYMKLKKD